MDRGAGPLFMPFHPLSTRPSSIAYDPAFPGQPRSNSAFLHPAYRASVTLGMVHLFAFACYDSYLHARDMRSSGDESYVHDAAAQS